METPTTVEAIAARSTQLAAAQRRPATPVPTPTTVQSAAAPSAIEAVTGTGRRSSDVTGSLSRNE